MVSLAAGRRVIQDLSSEAALKVSGSSSHRKLWRQYCHQFCEAVQAEIRRDYADGSQGVDDACAINAAAGFRSLEVALGTGADQGTMPDFAVGGAAALRGYSLAHFGRVRLLGEVMTQAEPDWLEERVAALFSRGGQRLGNKAAPPSPVSHLDLISLGGGPGYDYVSAVALSEYRAGPAIRATVYDYETQWGSVVSSVDRATRRTAVSDRRHGCDFSGCDVTLPLGDIDNAGVADRLTASSGETSVVACSYCLSENAVALRDRDWVFFRDLFATAGEGTVFFITDTTHRLWPELMEVAKEAGLRFTTPHVRAGKTGWQFVALKDGFRGEQYYITTEKKDLLERFTSDNKAHLRRLERGYKRNERKIRGAK